MSLLNIGLSGLNVSRDALTLVSQNIANANNKKYTRQELIQGARPSRFSSTSGFSGTGVQSLGVRRITNDFLYHQVLRNTSDLGYSDAVSTQLNRIDKYFGTEEFSLSGAVNDFFASAQDLASRPTDIATRQNFLETANSMARRFNNIAETLSLVRQDVNGEIQSSVDYINTLTTNITEVNKEIAFEAARLGDVSKVPGELLDERDALVAELAGELDIRTDLSENGQLNVYMANGQPLVNDSVSYNLVAQIDPQDSENLVIGRETYINGEVEIVQFSTKNLGNGALAGYVEFRDGPLTDYENTMGLLATRVFEAANEAFESGDDINGDPGKPLFVYSSANGSSDPVSKVVGNALNDSEAFPVITNIDTSIVRGGEYRVQAFTNPTTQEVEVFVKKAGEKGRGEKVDMGADGNYHVGNPEVFSFEFDVEQPVNGDSFTISLTRNAASSIRLNDLTAEEVVTAGRDEAIGDNQAALRMAGIFNQKSLYTDGTNGGVTIVEGFNRMVSVIGNQTKQANNDADSKELVLNQLTNEMSSQAGVNLDEEAAKMLQYQQSYTANGKVIAMSKELWSTVMSIF